MMALVRLVQPRSFTRAEALIEEVRKGIFGQSVTYKAIAERCNVSPSTVGNLANGKTKWPRPTTLFPLLDAIGKEMRLVNKGEPR